MIDLKIYDTAREGNYKEFMKIYEKDNNSIYSTLMDTVLVSALFGEEPYDERFKIVKFLIEKKVDVNLPTRVQKMNALHCFYYGVWRPDKDYLFEVTKLLVEYGVNLNAQDFNESIPLHYIITRNRLETKDIEKTLRYLIESGSDYTIKNKFNSSSLDDAKALSWRNGFLDIVKEYEESKKS